jgi:hypothetical protein
MQVDMQAEIKKNAIELLRAMVAARVAVRHAAADLSVTPGTKFEDDLMVLVQAIEQYIQWKKENTNVGS